jgi:hypothetical protein
MKKQFFMTVMAVCVCSSVLVSCSTDNETFENTVANNESKSTLSKDQLSNRVVDSINVTMTSKETLVDGPGDGVVIISLPKP